MRESNPFLDIFLMLIGLVSVGFYLCKDKISSPSDLAEINGTLRNYSFVEHRNFRSHTYEYYIYLNEYSTGFQIGANHVDWFDRVKFEQSEKQGDSLKIFISKYDYSRIGSNEGAIALGISSKAREFLNAEKGIRIHNSKTPLVFGLVFLIAGMILLYLDIKRRKKWKLQRAANVLDVKSDEIEKVRI